MENIIEQFKGIPTTSISDSMNGLNNLDPSIKPIKDEYSFAGRALTVKIPVGDNLAVLKAIRESKPNDVIIVDAKGDTYRAAAGDFVIGMAKTLGAGAFVVDGAIRDINGIRDLDFPVFCKGTTVAAGGKAGMGEINIPISCGGVMVKPGDIIVGDIDGVVVIPQEQEEEILANSLDRVEKDKAREEQISGNKEEIIKYLDQMIHSAK